MPWFSHYSIRINERQKTVRDAELEIILSKGANLLKVAPVNSLGQFGVPTTAVIRFDRDYPSVKNYW